MKLFVQFSDIEGASSVLEHLGEALPISKRIVSVELTPEQEVLLRPKVVGQQWDREKKQQVNVYEIRNVVSLQEEEK